MKKISKVILLLIIVLSLTGCTVVLKNSENKTVTNPETGQNLTKNILCQPENEEVRQLYYENNVDIDSLPKCSEFKATSGGYDGLWATIFVKPLAYLITILINILSNPGVAVMVASFLIRLLVFPLTKKTVDQSSKMKKAAPDVEKLEKKYADKKDQESQMKKAQEQMAIYKKYNINPISGCLVGFIQIPIFFAFLEAINRVPAIFEGSLFRLQLGTTPFRGIAMFDFKYLILCALIIVTTLYSLKFTNSMATGAQAAQMKKMMNFMVIFIAFASLTLRAAIALYWIVSSGFTILQNVLFKRGDK